MKGIFVSQAVLNKNNGGGQFVRSLIELLRKVVGEDNLTIVSLPDEYDTPMYSQEEKNLLLFEANPSTLNKAYNLLHDCPRYVSPKIFDEILSHMKKEKYDFVFLGFSTYAYFIKRIKKELGIPVFVMYQGVTPNTKKTRLVNSSFLEKIKAIPSYLMVLKREKINANLAACNIVHNIRERNAFYHYYKKEPDMFLPVFLADKFSLVKKLNPGLKSFSLLFVGSNFGPNLSGLKWFVRNVMNTLSKDITLYVVGQHMEVLRNEKIYQKDNIKIIGEVEDLAPWYYYSDLVIEPIFEGDGMKTKTVEAMMFGKTILGTDEAFCGYVGLEKYLCNSKEEFVDKINYYYKNGSLKFNEKIRDIYLQYYSEDIVIKLMKGAINKYVKPKEN